MRGMMMDRPLLISSILDYAANYHGDTELVSCTADDPAHRTSYAELRDRAKRLANGLRSKLGVGMGDRIATLLPSDRRLLLPRARDRTRRRAPPDHPGPEGVRRIRRGVLLDDLAQSDSVAPSRSRSRTRRAIRRHREWTLRSPSMSDVSIE